MFVALTFLALWLHFIDFGDNCILQIKGHNLTVIATDGYAVEPFTVDCVVSYPGERYDVVMHASNDPEISKLV